MQLHGMVPPALRNTEEAVYAHIKAVSFVEHLFAKTGGFAVNLSRASWALRAV